MIARVLEHPVLNRLSFFVLGLAAVVGSYLAWSLLIVYMTRPNMVVTSWKITTPTVEQGGSFTYEGGYIKEKDCPGMWTVRAVSVDTGKVYQIESGRVGFHAAGAYTQEWTVKLPATIPPGLYMVNEVIDGICDGGTVYITRGPADMLRIVR